MKKSNIFSASVLFKKDDSSNVKSDDLGNICVVDYRDSVRILKKVRTRYDKRFKRHVAIFTGCSVMISEDEGSNRKFMVNDLGYHEVADENASYIVDVYLNNKKNDSFRLVSGFEKGTIMRHLSTVNGVRHFMAQSSYNLILLE